MIKELSLTFLMFAVMSIYGCKKEEVNTLSVNPQKIEIPAEGTTSSMSISTDADSWSISNSADWVVLSNNSGTQSTALVTVSVNEPTTEAREATLTIQAGNADPVKVSITQPASEFIYTVTPSQYELSYKRAENSLSIRITSDAPLWTLSDNVEWLQYSQETGTELSTLVTITALENTNINARNAIITLHADYAPEIQISVTQKGQYYPNYNTNPIAPDATGMTHTAMEIAQSINIGWNIGNTMEAIGGETAWGNPMISPSLIQLVKESGFNAVRIPCSFNQYLENSATAQLEQAWLDRIKTVVQYCVDRDMYAILNIHWDGGWLENNCTEVASEANNAKQKAFWEQIATHLRDFDEHLIFAGTNEPNVDDATQMAVLNSYLQTFIDAVRSTGGRNSYRTLVVQGPSTDITKTHELMNTLPVDEIENRMMVEVHYYTPWNFCGMTEDASWGKMFYYWGEGYHSQTDTERNATYGEEPTVDSNFALMLQQFAQQGIPVVLGEYSPTRRSTLTGDNLTLHLASRAYYSYYVTKMAKANGMIPFYWDNGFTGNHGCAIFNRVNNTIFDQQTLDAIMEAANE